MKKPKPLPGEIDDFTAAARSGHIRTVSAFARRFGPKHLNAKDSRGDTALNRAARFNRVAVVRKLLAAGADPDGRDSHRGTPLMGAAVGGHVQVIKELLAHGADVTLKSYAHETAEWYARANKHDEAAKLIADAPRQRAEAAATLTAATTTGLTAGLEKPLAVGKPLVFKRPGA